jgi:hypothetical protein
LFEPDLDTVDGVVAWFLHDKHGDRDTDPSHDEVDLRRLVEAMTTLPSPFNGSVDEPLVPSRAWSIIIDYSLLYRNGKSGWLDRDGKMWSCDYATHTWLTYWLGMTDSEPEEKGWVRVSQARYRSRYRMTPKQRRALSAIGIVPDKEKERLLPVWIENDTRPISTENLGADRDDFNR